MFNILRRNLRMNFSNFQMLSWFLIKLFYYVDVEAETRLMNIFLHFHELLKEADGIRLDV